MTEEPKAWRVVFGVPSLLAFIAGSLALMVGYSQIAADIVSTDESSPFHRALPALIVAAVLLGAAVAFQFLREGGLERHPLPPATRFNWILLGGGVLFLFVPVGAGWVQFELYRDEILMFPVASLVAGITLGVLLANCVFRGRYRSSARMLSIAIVGMPLGLLAFAIPSAHFRHHGSAVVVYTYPEDRLTPKKNVFKSDQPLPPSDPIVGEGTLEMIGDLANALKNAERIDVAEKLETGAWVQKDGAYFERLEDGSLRAIEFGAADDLFEEFEDEARAKDQAQLEALKAEYERSEIQRKRGGRLFNRR